MAGASVSARSFQKLAERKFPDEPKKISGARLFGFWQPIGFYVATIAFLFFAVSGYGSSFFIGLLLAMFGISYLVLTTWAFKKKFDVPGIIPRVIWFTVLLLVLFAAEVFGGMATILGGDWFGAKLYWV